MAIGDWVTRFVLLAGLLVPSLCAQGEDTEYRVYTEHPRLILTTQRLRLLKRERERESQRWRQFDLLVKGSASLPEPGFALALYYAVAGDEAAGKRAVAWALGPADDLRQLALVYDWCQPILSPQQSTALAAKIHQLSQKRTGRQPSRPQRDRILALIATADDRAALGRTGAGTRSSRSGGAPDLLRRWPTAATCRRCPTPTRCWRCCTPSATT